MPGSRFSTSRVLWVPPSSSKINAAVEGRGVLCLVRRGDKGIPIERRGQAGCAFFRGCVLFLGGVGEVLLSRRSLRFLGKGRQDCERANHNGSGAQASPGMAGELNCWARQSKGHQHPSQTLNQ